MGIVSWGVHCGFREAPVVYTDVRFYKDWVLWYTESGFYSGFGRIFFYPTGVSGVGPEHPRDSL